MERLLVLISLIFTEVSSQVTNPCLPSNHAELNEPYRSTGYELVYPDKPLCDLELRSGWYRFTSEIGGEMPTSCQRRSKCGTVVPIWMNGTHPNVDDGVVSRQACGDFHAGGPDPTSCCDRSVYIKVKNCTGFYVYYLRPTPSCPISYCVGSKKPCARGKWSPTMLEPCTDLYPIMETFPVLRGPNIYDNTSFAFVCEITHPPENGLEAFEVVWTFNGKEYPDVPVQVISGSERNATLPGTFLKGHLNTYLECQVRSYFLGNEVHKSASLRSNSYYAGVEVKPPVLVISEQEYAKNVTITSTIPIICDDISYCCLTFRLDMTGTTDNEDSSIAAWVETRCHYQLCDSDWNPETGLATKEVFVIANQDMTNDGEQRRVLKFERLQVFGLGPYAEVFDNYLMNTVEIKVLDQRTSHCYIYTDPHVNTFDGSHYTFLDSGIFTACKVEERQFEVQIQTGPCTGQGASCVCGLVIREKNDIIRIDACNKGNVPDFANPEITVPHNLTEGVTLHRSRDGRKALVYLRSGAEIGVEAPRSGPWLKVSIYVPGVDAGMTTGLCGNNDGNSDNDFFGPNGNAFTNPCPEHSRCGVDIISYTNAWSVSREKSLWETLPALINDNDEVKYCVCKEDEARTVNCSYSAHRPVGNVVCYGAECPEADPVVDVIWSLNNGKREVLYEDTDSPEQDDLPRLNAAPPNPNKQWPNSQGVTESEAKEHCNRALRKSQLDGTCGGMSDMAETFFDSCMGDILFGGTLDFLEAITSAYTTECQATLAVDPANYVSNAEGKSVLRPEYLDDICDMACNAHGRCGEKGICVCNDGWEGFNCHIQSGIGPQIRKIRSGLVCDKAQRPCRKIFVDVSNINLSDDLICRVRKVDEQGNTVGVPVDTDVEAVSANKIACALPQTNVSLQHYKVSASNDGSLFGNEVSIHVVDSTCMECNENAVCTAKTTACRINNVCYSNGEKKKNDEQKRCDVTKDTTAWSDPNVVRCRGVQLADIIFVLDSSGSVGLIDYREQLKFMANLTGNFDLGPTAVRFGGIIFSSQVQKLFDLNRYSDHDSLSRAVLSAPYTGGGTDTAAALNYVANVNMFGTSSGGRANATKILIVMTDGASNSRAATIAAAQRLKNSGVQIISIGIGSGVVLEELTALASGSENMFQVAGFDVLPQIQAKVSRQTCGPNNLQPVA